MLTPENDAHNAVLISLATGVLAVLSFVVPLWSILISRTTARRTTEPILVLRVLSPAYGGHVEVLNIGTVTATAISIELIEKRRRASAKLYLNQVLKIGESSIVQASSFPDELNEEFRNQHPFGDAATDIQNLHRSLNDQELLPYPQDQMAFHLMTRQGGQRIILSCAIPDKGRQQRIYKSSENSELQLCSTFLIGLRANYLRFRFKRNTVLSPPPELPEFLKIDSEED